jgi:hypothetical protein
VASLRPWWRAPVPDEPCAPSEVVCACGHVHRVVRQRQFHSFSCGRCGEKVFVLPCSPLPPVVDPAKQSLVGQRRSPSLWLMPAAAGLAALFGLVLLYYFLLAPWLRGKDQPTLNSSGLLSASQAVSQKLQAARARLAEGSFRLALDAVMQARQEAGPNWQGLPRDQRRQWWQLHRQAALLADLSVEPLEDVLRHAAGVKEAEWRAEFHARYLGRAMVFDLTVQGTPGGRYRHNYALRLPDDEASLELGDLVLLHRLRLDQPQRLVFGARLARVGREARGGWVVHLQPDSGVLLTDAGAATACCPAFGDAGARALLEQQAAWLADDAGE